MLLSSGSNPWGAQDQYAKFGAAAKIPAAKTVVKYGAMKPDVPVLNTTKAALSTRCSKGDADEGRCT
jgi:hypothetical protein